MSDRAENVRAAGDGAGRILRPWRLVIALVLAVALRPVRCARDARPAGQPSAHSGDTHPDTLRSIIRWTWGLDDG